MRPLVLAAALAAALLAGTASAQIQAPPAQHAPIPGLRLPQPCGGPVDLAVTRITLYKLSQPGSVRVEFDIHNVGTGEWYSREGQKYVTLSVRNGTGTGLYSATTSIAGRFAASALVEHVVSPPIANAFDPEFSGTLYVTIYNEPDYSYLTEPDNLCNRDRNRDNDHLAIDAAGVRAFLSGTENSRTFRPPAHLRNAE